MKKNAIIIGMVLLLTAAVVSVQAQISHRYQAEIPFDFSANGSQLKAGSYSVGLLNISADLGPLMIQSRDGRVHRVLSISPRGSISHTDEGKLVFLKTGNFYTLTKVLTPRYGAKVKVKKTDADPQPFAIAYKRTEIVMVNLLAKNNL
jgi:hypothetical protein